MTDEQIELLDFSHRKDFSRAKNCRNCIFQHKYSTCVGCFIYDCLPTRNPRARAIKCKDFYHWLQALKDFNTP